MIAGAENPLTTWKALNRLRTETCDCGIRHADPATCTGLYIMGTACSTQDLTTANGMVIGCARHCECTT